MTFAPYAPEEQKTTRSTAQTRKAASEKRTLGEDAVPSPGHSTKNLPRDYREINGWGADLDPANRPSYPRELPADVMTARGDVRHWQRPQQKVYMSNEHPGLTPVFGETCPPAGLSGMLRDYAFQFGEATNRHWMTLMFADRVNVLESRMRDPRTLVTLGVAALGAIVLGALAKNALSEE
jgi:hypothetical protein